MFTNRNPTFVFLALTAASALAGNIIFTTSALYFITDLGLNPLQLVLIGTAMEAAIFLAEVPTGLIADLYSRKFSVVLGRALLGVAFLLQGFSSLFQGILPPFVAIVAASALSGIGYACISGATEAWITDEVGPEKVGKLFFRAGQVASAARLAGMLLSAIIASVSHSAPFIVGGAIYLALALFLALFMPETGFKPAPRLDRRSAFAGMAQSFRAGLGAVRGRPLLMLIMLTGLFWGASSEGFDRLWQAHLFGFDLPGIATITPATWLTLISVGSTVLSIAVGRVAERRIDTASERTVARIMAATSALRLGALLAFALAPSFATALAAYLAVGVIATVGGPIHGTWLNQNIDSSVRATVLSMSSQLGSLGEIAGGPGVGYVGSHFSLRAAMTASSLLLSPLVLAYGLVFQRVGQRKIVQA